tara:strand:- start:51 stop:773 length:723 start_codon:yes stop_codon:yes gene_type:complete
MTLDVSIFKHSVLIVVVLYRSAKVVKFCLDNVLKIIEDRPNTWLVLINNNAHQDVYDVFKTISSNKVIKFNLPFNFGKALAANFFFKEYISRDNLPETIISLDPDTVFSKESFELLVNASQNLPNAGMIGMRYTKNKCNPERNLFFKSKQYKGINGTLFSLVEPFMCTVAGPILAISAKKVLNDCGNELFPKKYIKVYGGDDSAIYNVFRWKYINGYLDGSLATHLITGDDIAEGYEFLV